MLPPTPTTSIPNFQEQNKSKTPPITSDMSLSQFKEALSQMIVHDLKDPMTVIQAGLQFVLQEMAESNGICTEKMEKALKNSLLNCRRQMNLINDLLEISELEVDPNSRHWAPVELTQVVDSVLSAYSAQFQQLHITLHREYSDELHWVQADISMLQRVLWNLVANSLKFTKPYGRLIVKIRLVQQRVECVIEDSGLMIPSEDLPHIFDQFFKGDPLGRFRKGQGFALAFCRLAIEAHGGTIWAERGQTIGNRFVFLLPYQPAA